MAKNGEHKNDDLLKRVVDGDEKAFYSVYDQFYNGLHNYAYKITGNRQESEDITIETFTKLFERIRQMESFTHMQHWLYLTVRNASIDYIKAAKSIGKRHQEWHNVFYQEADISYVMIEDEMIARINTAIETLPEQRKKIFKLLYIERLKAREVAEKLGISENTVITQKKRALIALRQIIMLLILRLCYM